MEEVPLKMKTWGKLKGREIVLNEEIGIPGEVEVEVEISFPKEEAEVFGIWKDRKDIKSSIDWVRNLRHFGFIQDLKVSLPDYRER
ncbi:MAG: hypothetical protein H8D26_00790 [Methanomicrobia archaeon]|nr:hypothetical protein [Methanomicrobia archaeon]